MRFGTARFGNQGRHFFHEGVNIGAMSFVKGANRAFHFDFIGNDIAAIAALKTANRHHRGLFGNIHFARDNGLQTHDNL